MKQCFKSLLASLLLSMPLFHIQAAAEIGPDNIYQILSGIEDLQDGTWRSIEKANHICSDTVPNTDLHALFRQLARAGEEGQELLLRIGTEFHIVIPGIIQPPLVDDSDEEGAGADPDGEVTGTEKRTPELPDDVLAFLYRIGKIGENYTDGMWIIPELQSLPPELFTLVCQFNPQLLTKVFPSLLKSIILTGTDGNPLRCHNLMFSPNETYIAALSNHCYHLYNDRGSYIASLKGKLSDHTTCLGIRFSPLGKFIAVLFSIGNETTNRYWQLFDNQGSYIFLEDKQGKHIACSHIGFSSDETYIVVEEKSNGSHLFDSQGIYITLKDSQGNTITCKSIQFSPDNQLIAAQDKSNDHCHLFDNQGTYLKTLKDSKGNSITCKNFKFSPYSQLIAALDRSHHCHLFDNQGTYIATLKNSQGTNIITYAELQFSPDGQFIAAQDRSYHCHLFDNQGTYIATLKKGQGNNMACCRIALSPDSQFIAAQDLNNGCHLFYSQGTYIPLKDSQGNNITYAELKFSPDSQFIAARDRNNHWHLFDNQGTYIAAFRDDEGSNITSLIIEFSSNSQFIGLEDLNNHYHLFDHYCNLIVLDREDRLSKSIYYTWINPSPEGSYIIAQDTINHGRLFDCQGNFLSLDGPDGSPLKCERIESSPSETYITAFDTSSQCHLFDMRPLKELNRHITPDQFLMLHLLLRLKEKRKPQVPFSICPVFITSALLQPLLTSENFATKQARRETLNRFKQVHDWVSFTLESFNNINLSSKSTPHDVLYESLGIEQDPKIKGINNEEKAHPCVRAYLACKTALEGTLEN